MNVHAGGLTIIEAGDAIRGIYHVNSFGVHRFYLKNLVRVYRNVSVEEKSNGEVYCQRKLT